MVTIFCFRVTYEDGSISQQWYYSDHNARLAYEHYHLDPKARLVRVYTAALSDDPPFWADESEEGGD